MDLSHEYQIFHRRGSAFWWYHSRVQFTAADIDRELAERFGFTGFRAGQRESVETLLAGGSLLCIQPTGYGKSLLYQLPAALLGGITLVVSPLLALMRDQLGHLNDRFGLPAGSINSDQSDEENAVARAAAAAGELRLLFVSPEHLDHVERFAALAALPVRLVVVDEAHCISTWGSRLSPGLPTDRPPAARAAGAPPAAARARPDRDRR